jgi:hypothetical protein
MFGTSRALATVCAIALAGCEATTTVVTRFQLPPSLRAQAARERMHVALDEASSFTAHLPVNTCPAFDAAHAHAAETEQLTSDSTGFVLIRSAIPSVPEFCAAAWYDTNGDGAVDAGDAVGSMSAPYPSQPSHFFSSNRYESPPVQLQPVP